MALGRLQVFFDADDDNDDYPNPADGGPVQGNDEAAEAAVTTPEPSLSLVFPLLPSPATGVFNTTGPDARPPMPSRPSVSPHRPHKALLPLPSSDTISPPKNSQEAWVAFACALPTAAIFPVQGNCCRIFSSDNNNTTPTRLCSKNNKKKKLTKKKKLCAQQMLLVACMCVRMHDARQLALSPALAHLGVVSPLPNPSRTHPRPAPRAAVVEML